MCMCIQQRFCWGALLILMLLIGRTAEAVVASSASYQLHKDTLNTGGMPGASTNYRLTDSIGQATVIDVSNRSSYQNGAGFWADLNRTPTPTPTPTIPTGTPTPSENPIPEPATLILLVGGLLGLLGFAARNRKTGK